MAGPNETGHQRESSDATGGVSVLETALWQTLLANRSDEAFIKAWIALLCRSIDGAGQAILILKRSEDDTFVPAAHWPDDPDNPARLSAVTEKALAQQKGVLTPADTNADGQHHLAYPLKMGDGLVGVVAVAVNSAQAASLTHAMRQLQWGTAWVLNLLLERDGALSTDKTTLTDVAAQVLGAGTAAAAEKVAVTELCTLFDCERVSLGFLVSDFITVSALSHSAQFAERSNLMRHVGAAMDEALAQDQWIAYPANAPDIKTGDRSAHRDLARAGDASDILTVPFGMDDAAVGGFTFERISGEPFNAADRARCREYAELLGALLIERRAREKSLISQARDRVTRQIALLGDVRETRRRVLAALALIAVLFLAFAEGDYIVTAPAVLEGQIQRHITATQDGFLDAQFYRAGDVVTAGEVLARLDDQELLLERLRSVTLRQQLTAEYARVLAEEDRSGVNVVKARMEQADAEIALGDEQLKHTVFKAHFDGVGVDGDLSQSIGSAVERGAVLYIIAPLDKYRVILDVDETDIDAMAVGQTGLLKVTSLPGLDIAYTVDRVTPVTVAADGRSFFRVEAVINDDIARLRPGMQGFGRTQTAPRLYLWIWTHGLIDWLRIGLWSLLP